MNKSVEGERDLFLRSLVFNLLFQKGGLTIPDSFFFNCSPLIGLLEERRHSIFTCALEQGLIVPAFRDPATASFRAAYRSVVDGQIRGITAAAFTLHRTKPSVMTERLDEAVRVGTERAITGARHPQSISWKPNMGELFSSKLRGIMGCSQLKHPFNENHDKLWKEIEPWRGRIFDEAEKATRAVGGTGIRRAEIFNELGQHLKYVGPGGSFDRAYDLVKAAGKDRKQARRLAFFVDAVNVAYHLSQAENLGVVPNFLSTHTAVASSIIDVHDNSTDVAPKIEPTVIKLWLPAVADILRADSAKLLEIRDGETGRTFFDARRLWMLRRSERSVLINPLRDAAKNYAKDICKVVGGPSHPLHMRILAGMGTGSGAGGGLVEVVKSSIGALEELKNISPIYGLAAGSAVGGAIAFVSYGNRRRVAIEIPRLLPEINL